MDKTLKPYFEATYKGECGQTIDSTKFAIHEYCNKCQKFHTFFFDELGAYQEGPE